MSLMQRLNKMREARQPCLKPQVYWRTQWGFEGTINVLVHDLDEDSKYQWKKKGKQVSLRRSRA